MTSRLFEEKLRFPSESHIDSQIDFVLDNPEKLVFYKKLDWLEENKEDIDTLGEREMNMEDPD